MVSRCRRPLAVGVCLALLPVACGDNQDEGGALDLLARVREETYRKWERAPGYETRQPTNAPHGDEVDIYINDTLLETLTRAEPIQSWPVGSTIVKDGWSGADLEIIAIMDKREDGWFWAEFDSGDDVDFSGRPDTCLDCHDSGADFVRAFGFPK